MRNLTEKIRGELVVVASPGQNPVFLIGLGTGLGSSSFASAPLGRSCLMTLMQGANFRGLILSLHIVEPWPVLLTVGRSPKAPDTV